MNIPTSIQGLVIAPWVGLGYIGSESDDVEVSLFSVSLGAEAKWFVGDDASVDFGVALSYADGETDIDGFELDASRIVIGPHIGISIWP